jgi:hypothetical protein
MPDRLSILCVHGIGHGDVDAALIPAWRQVITAGLQRWKPGLEVDFDFLAYDEEFDHAPLNAGTYAEALTRLAASGIVHGIGDLLPGTRGLSDMPALIRWTAGMIAQWATEDRLRERLRARVLDAVAGGRPDVVCAHSLGTLVCYDAFRRERAALDGRTFVTLGSQIGNPFVRDCFAGRIEALARARRWYHLYNSDDHVFTAELRIQADNFTAVETRFDKPNDPLNHDAIWYFDHANTRNSVWLDLSGARPARTLTRETQAGRTLGARPARRALLIGINAYPNPANRLEGCVNDVYLVSSVLQECGYAAEDIRVVLDERATTAGLLERFHWLLDDVQPGDERVLFYSGHGAQIPAYGPHQEVDHLNECLVPYDFDWSPEHAITDKQLVGFYSQLPYDSRFAAIFDCCHSASIRPTTSAIARCAGTDGSRCGRSGGCRLRTARLPARPSSSGGRAPRTASAAACRCGACPIAPTTASARLCGTAARTCRSSSRRAARRSCRTSTATGRPRTGRSPTAWPRSCGGRARASATRASAGWSP